MSVLGFQQKIVLHELGHALGLIHEHQRPDRDDYVTINFSNLRPSGRSNLEKVSRSAVNNHGVAYDLTSIMHYGPRVSQGMHGWCLRARMSLL